MALRIAPIQYNYLNHLSTCGIPNVDYIIGDYTAPDPNQQTYFAEQISRMKGCFLSFCYENSIAFEETPPSHTNPFVVFGCLSSQGKIGSLFLKACAQIVSHSANFRLLFRNHFLTDPNNKRLFFEIASLQGINLDQLILLDGCTNDAVLATYGQIDISLDTFPYNGGNTVCESLWQGVPVITLRGNKFAGQYAASILINSSLQELVTDSIQNYVATAINLAKDKTRLLEYRRSLRSRITKSKFNDGKFFAEILEEIFSRDNSTWKTRNGPGFLKGAWKDIALSD
jgi:predicted O-linked N-acetylglucosamine transferase (SPINDLY family)